MEKVEFDLQSLSVLSDEETRTLNGGIFGAIAFFIISTLVVAAIDSPEDFKAGYDSVRN